jgi:predicted amidohydrolase
MRISLIQTDIAWNDPDENLVRCARLANEALAEGGDLLIFPEMFTTGFSMPTGGLARAGAELGLQFLSEIATHNRVHTVASLPEIASDGSLFNTLWVCTPSGARVSYRKVHLFSYGDETKLYSPGSAFVSTAINDLSCSLFICYDLRFGAPFLRRASETDLFIVVANWPASRREHWLTLLRARAIENQAFVVGVNRVGEGGGLTYSGDSALYAPDGTELAWLGSTPGVETVTIEKATVSEWRRSFPALRDRRSDLYGPLLE